MDKRAIVISVFLLSVGGLLRGQPSQPKTKAKPTDQLAIVIKTDNPLHVSGGEVNGRFWRNLPPTAKSGFMMGYDSAVAYISLYSNCGDFCLQTSPKYSWDERVTLLDAFFEQPENRPLPVSWALFVLYRRLEERISAEEEARYVSILRQEVAKAQ